MPSSRRDVTGRVVRSGAAVVTGKSTRIQPGTPRMKALLALARTGHPPVGHVVGLSRLDVGVGYTVTPLAAAADERGSENQNGVSRAQHDAAQLIKDLDADEGVDSEPWVDQVLAAPVREG